MLIVPSEPTSILSWEGTGTQATLFRHTRSPTGWLAGMTAD